MIGSRAVRGSNVRVKVVALLASMTALWAFAAYVTVKDGLNVLFVSTLTNQVGKPTEALLDTLQQERRLSAVAMSDPAATEPLVASRARTDQAYAAWRAGTSGSGLSLAASDELTDRLAAATGELGRLAGLRREVDRGGPDRAGVLAGYTAMIEAGFGIYGSVAVFDDQEIAQQSRTLIMLTRARELLSQEDALVAGALAAGELRAPELAEFTKLVGAQRFLYQTTAEALPEADYPLYQDVFRGPAVTELRELEDRLVQQADPGAPPPISAGRWREAITPAIAEIRELELAAADRTLDRATPAAAGVIVRLLLAGGLGLIAVVAAVVISITTARSLVRQLERLRDAARELARHRLPRVVERLSAGETVDVAAEAPPLRFGNDEIGQVGQAFNAVQETAVRAAVQQAELRRGVRDVFLSLARRTQNLVHKQLRMVDEMERRETDADEMADLYRIDHLATRMRRNAENLIVLAGAAPGRGGRRAVPMIDVVRGAMAEVEDYQRVAVQPVQAAALAGRVVGDVIHLLAELIENATSFSPPYAMVGIGGQRVAHGFVVEIEDRGLGMGEAELAEANRQLADPPDFSLADASRLGHYVVAKLAQRHGLRVHLRTSPYGGITAIVLIPQELMAEPEEEPSEPATVAAPVSPNGGSGRSPGEPAADPPEASPRIGLLRWRQLPEPPPEPRPVPPPVPPPEPRPVPPPEPANPVPAGRALGPDRPVPDPPAGAAEPADVRTGSGLPSRVRQASLPRQLQDDSLAGEPEARDPELVRRAMRSYQLGTQRGRTDAQALPEPSPPQQRGDRQEG
jgi:methyl-accepting chemotaxis protein